MGAGDARMAGQSQLESSSDTDPFHRCHKGLLRSPHRVKEPVGGDHELLHLVKRTPALRIVHLLQIRSRAEVSFLQAHQHDAGDGSGLFGEPHDLLPLRQALHIEHIDRLAGVIKPRQQDPVAKHVGLEVLEPAGSHGVGLCHAYFLSRIMATPCPPPTHALISARSAFRRLSSNSEVMAKRRPDTPTG